LEKTRSLLDRIEDNVWEHNTTKDKMSDTKRVPHVRDAYNIAFVIQNNLCTGCGTCAAVCPTEAIRMKVSKGLILPEIESQKCNLCQLCIKSCPGHSVDFEELNSKIFGQQPKNSFIGNYLECYIGHSTNDNIRYNSASGGIVTQLLLSALENNVIDGALVIRMRKDNPLESEAFIARTREEIISASKSKYCPVAPNSSLRQILKEEGRYAVVGLPCHLHGIRKAERIFKTLEEKIVLHIGLLCSHMVNFTGTEFILEKKQINKEYVKKICYRGKGWPGSMSIQLKYDPELDIPLFGKWNSYWPVFASFLFTPIRCTMCPDQSAELADIALGDAWLPELKKEKIGKSVIIARTLRGKNILALASSTKAIDIKPLDVEKVEQSQAINLVFKKKDLPTRLSLLRLLGKVTPKFYPAPDTELNPISLLRAFFIYFNIWASSNKRFGSILLWVPFPFFRLYYGIYKFVSLI
jgi:coenzyme F420 hydrogenase subunit beta